MKEANRTLSDMDALILVGGQGTRIRHLLPKGVPKCMADVGGILFLDILIRHLRSFSFKKLILASGYGYHALDNHLTEKYGRDGGDLLLYREHESRGTAGAVEYVKGNLGDPFWIFNGDTYCDVNCKEMLARHEATKSTITVACDEEFGHVGTFVASKRFVDLIPKVDGKVDMAEIFTLLGQRHEPVGWFLTDAPFYDIGDETGLSKFRILMLQHGTLNVQ